MNFILPYFLDKFPKTEDLLLLLSCRDMFQESKVKYVNIASESILSWDKKLCIIPGELSNFTEVLNLISNYKASRLICLSVNTTEEKLKTLSSQSVECAKTLLNNGQLTAYDKKNATLLSSYFNVPKPEVTGSIFFFNQFKKIPNSFARAVCFNDQKQSLVNESFSYQELSLKEEILFIPNNYLDLEEFASPGLTTLVTPLFPTNYADALASASHIYSNVSSPLLIAATLSIPFTATYNIETDTLLSELNSVDLSEKKKRIECYKKITSNLLNSFDTVRLDLLPENRITNSKATLASISDSNYYPFLRGWIINCLRYEEDPSFHILALDAEVSRLIKQDFPSQNMNIHNLQDLWSKEELPEILTRSIGNRAYSTKPRLIQKAIEIDNLPVIYADSDVYFFSSPFELVSELGDDNVLLFPHWNEHKKEARKDGLFNAGMITVSTKALPFLKWWSEACYDDCRIANDEGVVGDQGYLDFAPVYFERVKSYHKGNHNVARWNLKSLGAKRKLSPDFIPELATGESVKSFHAAFIDGLGFFECKAAWDQICNFFSKDMQKAKSKHFIANTITQQSRHWIALSRALRIEKMILKTEITSPKSTLREMLMSSVGKKLIKLLYSVKKMETMTESMQTPLGLEADTVWCRFQKMKFLDLAVKNKEGEREKIENVSSLVTLRVMPNRIY